MSPMFAGVAMFLLYYYADIYGPRNLTRLEWMADEPMLVSESLFAVANIFRLELENKNYKKK